MEGTCGCAVPSFIEKLAAMDRRGSCGGDSILSIVSFLGGAGGFAIMGWGVRPLINISRPLGLKVAKFRG